MKNQIETYFKLPLTLKSLFVFKKIILLIMVFISSLTLISTVSFAKSTKNSIVGNSNFTRGLHTKQQLKNKIWIFTFKSLKKETFQIKKSANTYEDAYKSAAKECFQKLTQGKYPGEETGLTIIDICANPKS